MENDREVMNTAIGQNVDAFQSASPELRKAKEFVLPHIKANPDHIK